MLPSPTSCIHSAEVAFELLGDGSVDSDALPLMGSEDFSDMASSVPGAFFWLGSNPGPDLHSASYDFDDTIIPIGSALLARLIERRATI